MGSTVGGSVGLGQDKALCQAEGVSPPRLHSGTLEGDRWYVLLGELRKVVASESFHHGDEISHILRREH